MLKYYDSLNERLVYVKAKASPDFWNAYWQKSFTKIKYPRSNRLIQKWMHKYIPDRKGLILEGGCGVGDKVYCMHKDGYRVIGLDFAEATVHRVKEACSELEVMVGDCFHLPFKKEVFKAYWSLGVIEHFYDGYDRILAEISRVLEKEGYLFITFPSMSPLRKIKAALGLYKKYNPSLLETRGHFYQFALNEEEVVRKLVSNGFRFLEKKRYDGAKGLKDELGFLNPVSERLDDAGGRLKSIIKSLLDHMLPGITGHLSLLVFKKVKN